MTSDAADRFNIANLRGPVVALCTVGMSRSGMQIGGSVALFAGVGEMKKYLGCGCCLWSSTAISVTGKAFGCIKRIMTFN